MTPRAGKHFRTSPPSDDLTVTHPHAAGIDVHAAVHFVAVPAEDVPAGFVNPEPKLPAGARKFGTNTGDLEALADWLTACRVVPSRPYCPPPSYPHFTGVFMSVWRAAWVRATL
jgi:hypothetical protein